MSPHPHAGALRDLPRTRGCPRVSPVANDRRSFRLRPCGATPRQDGTRNRRLTAHERMYHLAECQMILCNPARLWRAGYKPRRMAGCSRRDDSHGWNPWDTTHAYPPRNAPVWGCGLTQRVVALMRLLAPIIAYHLSRRSLGEDGTTLVTTNGNSGLGFGLGNCAAADGVRRDFSRQGRGGGVE